jgi:nucleotide-binding universal stress UspA family protein
MSYRNILCPVDFSDASHEAMRAAVDLASAGKGQVTLLHVIDESGYFMAPEGYVIPDLIATAAAAAEKGLADLKAEASKLGAAKLVTRTTRGSAWNAIVELLHDEPGFDLVVMGTHGRTGLRHAFIGSVAERVVRHAPCPVLVVRARPKS